jgi:hypothetical protein
VTSDESTNLWVDAPCHDRAPSSSPYRQYSTARFSFSRSDEFLRLEVIEDRAQRQSTIVVSQLPVDAWHSDMADPTLAEALLERILQASHRITMKGPSQRKRQPDPIDDAAPQP